MIPTISSWFSGIASKLMPKQEPLLPVQQPQQQKVASLAPVISTTAQPAQASAKSHTAEPLSDKGWFAPVTGFFRDKFYSCIKGKESQHSQEVRQAYLGIGGQEITLRASTMDVRTVTFKAENFHQEIQKAGGKFVDLVDPATGKMLFPAIEVPKGLPSNLQSYLKQMGILDSAHANGQWKSFESDGKIYLVSAADYADVTTSKYMLHSGFNHSNIAVKERGDVACRAKSTVILSGPIYSHFESYNTAREVGAFLIRGLDVLIFEDKNPTVWDSESVTHTEAARDAIYAHVLAQPGMQPSNVIWKGTCFGAIPNVVAAAKYPGSAVIADQTFVNFSDVASAYAGQKDWGKWVPSFIRKPVIAAAAYANDCAHSLQEALPKVQGPVCLIENDRDELIPREMRQSVRNLLPAHSAKEVVHINNKNVDHAEGWYKDAQAAQKVDQFLIKIGATQGAFLNQRAAAAA